MTNLPRFSCQSYSENHTVLFLDFCAKYQLYGLPRIHTVWPLYSAVLYLDLHARNSLGMHALVCKWTPQLDSLSLFLSKSHEECQENRAPLSLIRPHEGR